VTAAMLLQYGYPKIVQDKDDEYDKNGEIRYIFLFFFVCVCKEGKLRSRSGAVPNQI
jgi:hypothetical protein